MRDYGKVSPAFWTGKTGRALRGDPDAQIVALYLMTCPQSSWIGVFHLPPIYVSHETGVPLERAKAALDQLAGLGFCLFDPDHDLIWVREMARFQIAEALKAGDKRVSGIASEFQKLPEGAIKAGFYERYRDAFHLPEVAKRIPLASPMEGGSESGKQSKKGLPAPRKPLRSQEQEQEQEQDRFRLTAASVGLEDLTPAASANQRQPDRADHDPDADLFRRGREVLGKSSGGQVAKLKAKFEGSIPKARAAIETASTKNDPAEYVAAVIRGPGTGPPNGQLYDRGL